MHVLQTTALVGLFATGPDLMHISFFPLWKQRLLLYNFVSKTQNNAKDGLSSVHPLKAIDFKVTSRNKRAKGPCWSRWRCPFDNCSWACLLSDCSCSHCQFAPCSTCLLNHASVETYFLLSFAGLEYAFVIQAWVLDAKAGLDAQQEHARDIGRTVIVASPPLCEHLCLWHKKLKKLHDVFVYFVKMY